jgi:hypothetical protein
MSVPGVRMALSHGSAVSSHVLLSPSGVDRVITVFQSCRSATLSTRDASMSEGSHA